MGYCISNQDKGKLFSLLSEQYDLYAPKVMVGEGTFSDTDVIRYEKVNSFDEIEWGKKSDYSFKELLLPINETMFYFTEDQVTVPAKEQKKKLIFLRHCDMHSVKRFDQMYLNNGPEDFYYKRRRENVKFVLMGCQTSCQTGFCVSMNTNIADDYHCSIKLSEEGILVDCKDDELQNIFEQTSYEVREVSPDHVEENNEKVTLPKKLSIDSYGDELWKEYGSRCINCGRCNFVCPTCTCFTTQDIFYQDNKRVGERRRVWGSCQIDGYTDMAGGISFRKTNGERMRFKVMHKIYDYEKRFGYPMCVGCGRCDAVCPEYISYSALVNKLAKKEEE